jgi:hypothetical protein
VYVQQKRKEEAITHIHIHTHTHTHTQAYLENDIEVHPSLLLKLLDEMRDGEEGTLDRLHVLCM